MKSLVTGGGGYLGKKLLPLLLKQGEVCVLDRSAGPPTPGVTFMKGDIRDPSLDLSGFDAVFHLAAVSLPSAVEKDRAAAWDVNVNGTWNIAKRLGKGQKLVFMSSAHVYSKSSAKEHTEDEAPEPDNFYGLTKAVGEQLIRFHAKSAGFSHVIFRLFNSYSADQPKGLIIGDLMEKYRGQGDIEVRNPRATLDMVHVDDAVKAISGGPSLEDGVYNICSGHPITVGGIYSEVKRFVGDGRKRKEVVVSDNAYRMLGDNSRLRARGYRFREFSLG